MVVLVLSFAKLLHELGRGAEDRPLVVTNTTGWQADQNAFIERFNWTLREEVLDAYLFDSLDQVRVITAAWLAIYNTMRPHDSLGQMPPLMFLPRPDADVSPENDGRAKLE